MFRLGIARFASLLVTLSAVGSAPAGLAVHEFTVQRDFVDRVVRFQVLFDQEPDWFKVDLWGRQHDSFSVYVDTDYQLTVDVQVTAGRLAATGFWWYRDIGGAWRDPFLVDPLGQSLTLALPFNKLGYAGTGDLRGELATFRYGALQHTYDFDTYVVPTPSATLLGLLGLALASCAKRRG